MTQKFHSKYLPIRNENWCPYKQANLTIYGSIVHNCPKMKKIKYFPTSE